MVLLMAAIIIALLVTIVLPILAGVWLNKNLAVPWRVITYGALGFFILQALLTLIFSGLMMLIENETLSLSEPSLYITQLLMSIFFGALLGVIIRWAGMKFLKEPLVNIEAAYGIGLGFGGVESILRVGLPLLITFITMLSNINIDPQTTRLDPDTFIQLEALWQVPAFVPLAGSFERLAAFVMHITVTILILQAFTRKNFLWVGAAVGLELLVNGLVVGLAEMGLAYGWVIGVAILLMVGNLYLLYRLRAFEFDITKAHGERDSSANLSITGD
jgi:uncharacterized membrane protein YhfC